MPKKPVPTADCETCGEEYRKWPKNRRYCGGCQVIRDLNNGITARKCETCDEVFWPLRQSHKECYFCSNWRPERADTYPACSQCDRHYRPAYGVERICVACVTSSEEMRDRYLKSLKIRRRQRLKSKEGS